MPTIVILYKNCFNGFSLKILDDISRSRTDKDDIDQNIKKVIFIFLARVSFIWKFSDANKTQINRKLEIFSLLCVVVYQSLECLN